VAITILRPCLTTHTTRLAVRPLVADDYAAWRTANEQHPPPASPYDPPPRTAAELTRGAFRAILRRYGRMQRNDVFYNFALLDRAQKSMFGLVTIQIVARIIVQLGWIGWRVFGQHRRNGYAREGVEAVLGVAFRELSLHRVEAGIEPANRVSAQLARSLGMRRESSETKSVFTRGAWCDLDVYAINAEDCGVEMTPTFGVALADVRRVEAR
jgi:ribosomal-protein-alanine N-acetyltransferase